MSYGRGVSPYLCYMPPKKRTRGVFHELLPTTEKRAAWESFALEFPSSDDKLKQLLHDYYTLSNDSTFLDYIRKLSALEYKIIQYYCMNDPEITLSPLRQHRGGTEVEYVVARAPFIEQGKVRPEIRVYVGRADELKQTINELYKNKTFMKMAKQKVVEAMQQAVKAEAVSKR